MYRDYELQDLIQVTTRRYRPDGSCQMMIRYANPQPDGVFSCAVYLKSNGYSDIKKYYRNQDFTGLLYSIKTFYAQDGSYTHTIIRENPHELSAILKYKSDNTFQYGKFYKDKILQELYCIQTRGPVTGGYAMLYSFSEEKNGFQSKVDLFDNNGVMTGSTYYKRNDFKDMIYTLTFDPYDNGEVAISWYYSEDQGGWCTKTEEYTAEGSIYRIRYYKDEKFEQLFRVEEYDEDNTLISSTDY